MKWFIKALRHYADFSGRARRKEYWMFVLFNIIFFLVWMILTAIPLVLAGFSEEKLLSGLSISSLTYSLAVLLPGLAVSVRRLHDRGKSGWMLLIGLIPLVGIWILVLMLLRGQEEENEYGPDPKTTPEVFTGQAMVKSAGIVMVISVTLLILWFFLWSLLARGFSLTHFISDFSTIFWPVVYSIFISDFSNIFRLAAYAMLLAAGILLLSKQASLRMEGNTKNAVIAVLAAGTILFLLGALSVFSVMSRGGAPWIIKANILLAAIHWLPIVLLTASLLFLPQNRALIRSTAVLVFVLSALELLWNIWFGTSMGFNFAGGGNQILFLVSTVAYIFLPLAFIVFAATFFSEEEDAALGTASRDVNMPVAAKGANDRLAVQPAAIPQTRQGIANTFTNNSRVIIKDLKCPNCGLDDFDAVGEEGATSRVWITLLIGLPFFPIGLIIASIVAGKIAIKRETKPIRYKCKGCKHVFIGEPVKASREETLSAPCMIQFERTSMFLGAWNPQMVYLNGIKVGYVKNGKTIAFPTHVKQNTILVTDQFGVAFPDKYTFEAEAGQSVTVRFKRKFSGGNVSQPAATSTTNPAVVKTADNSASTPGVLHIRFNIDAVDSGVYGMACYKIVFAHAPVSALYGCVVSMGDSNATLGGQENVCVIGLAGAEGKLKEIMQALKDNPEFKSVCANNPLVLNGPPEPLVGDGVFTEDGSQLKTWAKAAFDSVEKTKVNKGDIISATEKLPLQHEQVEETVEKQTTFDESSLFQAARNSQNEQERRTAIIALQDQSLLHEIVINASAESKNIGLDTLVALKKINDYNMLNDIAKRANDWSIRAHVCRWLEDMEILTEVSKNDSHELVREAANSRIIILGERKPIDSVPSFESLFFQIGLFARGETTDGMHDPYSYKSMSQCDQFVLYGKDAAQVIKSYLMACAAGKEQYGWWQNSSLLVECIALSAGTSEADRLMLHAWLFQLVNVQSNIHEYDTNVRRYAQIELDAIS